MSKDGSPLNVLRRVGLVAIIVGSLDVLSMAYSVAHRMDYTSSLNIFAIIAGIFLYRGSVSAARVCANFCACFLGAIVTVVVLLPLGLLALFPFDFWIALVRHDPNLSSAPLAFALLWVAIIVALFAYVNRALTTGVVTGVYGNTPPRPYWRSWWSAAGISLAAVSVVTTGMFLSMLFNGEAGHRAVRKAQERLGAASASYAFQVTNLHITRDDAGTMVDARVIAYNSKEVRQIEVEWQE